MAEDKVKVVIAFDEDVMETGKTREVTAEDARILVRDGRAQYATDAQERKADKVLNAP